MTPTSTELFFRGEKGVAADERTFSDDRKCSFITTDQSRVCVHVGTVGPWRLGLTPKVPVRIMEFRAEQRPPLARSSLIYEIIPTPYH